MSCHEQEEVMKCLYRQLFMCLMLLCAGQLQAANISQWDLPDGKMFTLAYQSLQKIRIELGQGNQILVLGRKSYLISGQGGARVAVDMAEMGGTLEALGGMMAQRAKKSINRFKGSKALFKKTGRRELVGAYTGEVYDVFITTTQGRERHEVVVSKHPDVLVLQAIFMELGTRAAKIMGNNQTLATLNYFSRQADSVGIGGVLRYGHDLKLRKLEKKALPATYFSMPKGVTVISLPVFPGL